MKHRMHPGNLLRSGWVHFTVALLVGLVLGTGIGIGEGVWVLLSQGVLGRYDELVAWAIVVDAGALIGVEFGLALLGGVILFLVRLVSRLLELVVRHIDVDRCSLAPRGRWMGTRPYATPAPQNQNGPPLADRRSLAPRGRWAGTRPYATPAPQNHYGPPLAATRPQSHQVAALVSLQLGETVFVTALAWGIWSQGTVNPSLFASNPLGVLLPPAAAGLALGELVLAASMWMAEHAPIVGRLHARHWLILEVVVFALAIAFGFTR